MSIQSELQASQHYMLSTTNKNGKTLVDLTPDNVARVEAMIQIDSAYRKSTNVQAALTKNYDGSTAYWMNELQKRLANDYINNPQRTMAAAGYRTILDGAIKAVDRENSTHLNADKIGRDEILDRLMKITVKDFYDNLKDPCSKNYWLIEEISNITHPTAKNNRGNLLSGRKNLSFASKFCHYACFYLFAGKDEQDNFSIYDNILKDNIPKYLDAFNIRKETPATNNPKDIYIAYQTDVDAIIDANGRQISRNGFDHLVWYYHKGE